MRSLGGEVNLCAQGQLKKLLGADVCNVYPTKASNRRPAPKSPLGLNQAGNCYDSQNGSHDHA